VVVSVVDLNDNTAVISSGATGSVNENADTTTVIYTAAATDADGTSANNTLTYSLTGADAAALTIDAATGEVRLNASADYETKASYSFTVVASDGTLSSNQNVVVSVIDLNDNTAVISSGATGTVNENADTTTVIYTAAATDADGTSAHNTLSYSLTGADAALLTIDAATGEVRLNASADYETKASYSFTVVASDGTLSSNQDVVVSVVDLNDNPPTLTAGGASNALVEAGGVNNATTGINSATISFSKGDLDTVGTVSYDTGFLIETGWVSTDGGLTFSKAGSFGTATFSLASGVVTYLLDNSDGDTQALTAGQLASDIFTIRVTDGIATQARDAIFVINGSNDAPTAVGSVPAMTGTLGQVFAPVTVAGNLFADIDGSETGQLLLSVENLPEGLVFDPLTRTISGLLSGNVTGVLTLQLVATDPNGGQVRIPVTLTIEPAPIIAPEVVAPAPAPAPVAPVVEPQAIEIAPISLSSLPQGTVDSAGTSSGFAAQVPVGTSSFSSINTPAPASTSAVVVNVGADGQVQITQPVGDSLNSSLTVANMIIQTGQISIMLADTVGAASFSATLADGTELPDWVKVNPVTGEVTMTPPPGQGKVTLRINAVDANGVIRVLEIEVDLENLPDSTAPAAEPLGFVGAENVTAFMSLDQQLSVAAGQADGYGSSVMKLLAS
jgi:VCBS repeat-containing protein